ncbi:hypothetical protein SAMN04244576_06604, partial [Sinorhizobium meliloti]
PIICVPAFLSLPASTVPTLTSSQSFDVIDVFRSKVFGLDGLWFGFCSGVHGLSPVRCGERLPIRVTWRNSVRSLRETSAIRFDRSRACLPPPFKWTPTSRILSPPRRNVRFRSGIQPFLLRRSHHGNNTGHFRSPAYAGAFAGASRARLNRQARAQQHLLVIGKQCAVEWNEQVVGSTIW